MIKTTDEMDSITKQERNDLMGYCEDCQLWSETLGGDAHTCGQKWSKKIGHQLTTKRSFSAVKRK